MKQPTFRKLILDDLRSWGLHDIIKKITSVRYEAFSGGDAVRVSAVNLNKLERDVVESLLSEYKHGYFDGMTDCYNYTESKKPRSAKYVTLSHEYSPDVKSRAKLLLKNTHDISDDTSAMKRWGCWYDQAIRRVLSNAKDLDTLEQTT